MAEPMKVFPMATSGGCGRIQHQQWKHEQSSNCSDVQRDRAVSIKVDACSAAGPDALLDTSVPSYMHLYMFLCVYFLALDFGNGTL